MRSSLRLTLSASALLTAALLASGCTAAADSSEPAPSAPGVPGGDLELDAAWLDEGRMVALVTWGSSSCVPVAETVTATGQTVSVTLDAGDPTRACTADYAARASVVVLPEGVDPTQDVELIITLGEASGDAELDGNPALAGVPGQPTDYAPSAGWFDDGSLVLLTWGSSTCPPVVESVEVTGSAGTVGFAAQDGPCTMDLVPRATVIGLGPLEAGAEDAFVLTLVGGGLDATLNVYNA
ncbi:hypothetical protein ACR5KS_11710 [Leucobacter sp. W1153]|uniref:hypothetical protein n=1 Tax=Leucobacter sp. W1153 TaxID=3439064 RepID=UPI003F35076E